MNFFVLLVLLFMLIFLYLYSKLHDVREYAEKRIQEYLSERKQEDKCLLKDIEQRVSELENILLRQDNTRKISTEINRQLSSIKSIMESNAATHAERLGTSYQTALVNIKNIEQRILEIERKLNH